MSQHHANHRGRVCARCEQPVAGPYMGSFMDMYNAIFGHMLHSWHNDEQDSGESPTVRYYHVRKPVQQGGRRVVRVYYDPRDASVNERDWRQPQAQQQGVHVVHVLHAANNNSNQSTNGSSQQQQQQQSAASVGGELRVVCTSKTSRVVVEYEFPSGFDTESIPDDFICPMSKDIMREPVVTSDGHTYEREYICKWFNMKGTSPTVATPLLPIAFRNVSMQGNILEWVGKMGGKASMKTVENSL
jgi:hypothetical protein